MKKVRIGLFPSFILFYLLSVEGIAGLLIGVLASGISLSIFWSNSGEAWDNAKKYIETNQYGGKGSYAYISAIIGDTIGDPLKDTTVPSLNILIKFITIISLVILPLLIKV